jgi:glycosyltransferase involved in cell wall biosynthesis
MATFNGGRFIADQLASIADQSVAELDLLVSDDGSTDDTMARLERARTPWRKGRFDIIAGPRSGNHADNFRHLFLSLADEPIVALSDQDDVWLPRKLENAIAVLASVPAGVPAVYCSRTALIDMHGASIGQSPYFPRGPAFGNALVQSLAGGNTMVLNPAAVRLVRESFRHTRVPAHDWWIYMIVTGAGGRMIYSPTPDTHYRQHDDNAVGNGSGWRARLVRLHKLLQGRFRDWNDANVAALLSCRSMLRPEARATLENFMRIRAAGWRSPFLLWRSHIYRQTTGGHAMLYVAAFLGLA